MRVANADALEQREKRVNEELKNLKTKRTGLRAIFASCLLGAAVTVSHVVSTNVSTPSSAPTFSAPTAQPSSQGKKDNFQLKASQAFAFSLFFVGGLFSAVRLPDVKKKIRTTESRKQILQSLRNNP